MSFNFFRPKTTQSILANIYKQIDELEIVAEQQEVIYDQSQAHIDELRQVQAAATEEGTHAERVAAKLRSLVEV